MFNVYKSTVFVGAAHHLCHAVGGTISSDKVVERHPINAHVVFGIFSLESLALPRHRHYVTRSHREEVVGVMVGVLLADAYDVNAS